MCVVNGQSGTYPSQPSFLCPSHTSLGVIAFEVPTTVYTVARWPLAKCRLVFRMVLSLCESQGAVLAASFIANKIPPEEVGAAGSA